MATTPTVDLTDERSYDPRKSVGVHLEDLRKVLIATVITLTVSTGVSFLFVNKIVSVIQKPLDQPLYYTTPGGGLTFALKVCLTVGLIVTIPVFLNRLFWFVKPAINPKLHRSFAVYTACSFLLAILGATFGYLLSLPAALNFLTSIQIDNLTSLISADSYYSFLFTYLIGYAILFQTPIVMLFVNQIRPRGPRAALKYERHVIGGSFVVAAILTPTPDPWNQLLMALPIIILYQVGIVAIWISNKNTRRKLDGVHNGEKTKI